LQELVLLSREGSTAENS